MTTEEPKFIKSEWVYIKPQGGYALKKGAPKDVKRELNEWIKLQYRYGYGSGAHNIIQRLFYNFIYKILFNIRKQ